MTFQPDQSTASSRSQRPPIMSRSTPPPPYRPKSPSLPTPVSIQPSSSSHNTFMHSDPPSEASGGGHTLRRRASSSISSSSTSSFSQQTFSPSSVYPTPDLSTAPTSPSQSIAPTTIPGWRPTPNVPAHIHRRHRRMGSDGEESNRWLSEDEGGGSASTSLRRRRSGGGQEGSGSGHRRRHQDRSDRGDAGPSTLAHRARDQDKITSTEEAIAVVTRAKSPSLSPLVRPRPIRARSFDPTATSAISPSPAINRSLHRSAVGQNPPTIEQLVPPPSSSSDAHIGLGIRGQGAGSIPSLQLTAQEPQIQRPQSAIQAVDNGFVPDFALGRGGDGISGAGLPISGPDGMETTATRKQKRIDLIEKLSRILGCALCPPVDGIAPLLHHPITLPCGHTLSSRHISIPTPAPLRHTNEPPHEVAAAQERQHQQRLSLWAGVMCPIPTCKRYSPTASTASVFPAASANDVDPPSVQAEQTSSVSGQRTGLIASGVSYYPPLPAPVPPPAYSPDAPVTENGSPLLDISVYRILSLVQQEMSKEVVDENTRIRGEETDVSDSSDEEEIPVVLASQTSIAGTPSSMIPSSLIDTGGRSAGMMRTSSKRRRHHDRSTRRSRTTLDQSNSARTEMTFEKELMGTLECDVCALLLYEPVTTPCQHSFCAKCLSRSLDHSSRCPVCRQDLPSFAFFQDHAVNKVLLTIIKTAFPEDYAERQLSIERDERDARLDTPIFVCTLAFPGMPTILHVFEPRYRLMIRRCIESSSPRFGMVLPARGTGAPHLQGVMEYGTMLEIQSVQMLPDGRSMVETVGVHRFKLLEKGGLDGYTVGRIERIDDVSPEEEIAMEREAVERAAALALSRKNEPDEIPDLTSAPATSDTGLTAGESVTVPGSASQTQPATSGLVVTSAGPSMPVSTSSTEAPASALTTEIPIIPSAGAASMPGMPVGSGGFGGGGGGMDFAAMAAQSANAQNQSAPGPTVDETPETTEELMDLCRAFIDQLRSGSAPWLLQRLNNTYGVMPTDPSEFSYWMALVMPIDEYEKARLLPIRSPRLRLKLIVHWVESLRSSWWFSSGVARLVHWFVRH